MAAPYGSGPDPATVNERAWDMLEMWFLTVASPMNKTSAISRFVVPMLTRQRMLYGATIHPEIPRGSSVLAFCRDMWGDHESWV